jgi:hypothetical protein
MIGMKIRNDCDNWEENEQKIREKVRKEINFWKRFNLSLPGRINIAKTMLYSQLNYLGCFLPLSEHFEKEVERQVGDYVTGNLKMGRDRVFEPVEMGGLGIFRVSTFLMAQKCSWFKRAMSMDELWKLELFSPAPGDFFSIRKDMIFADPSYDKFLVRYTENIDF